MLNTELNGGGLLIYRRTPVKEQAETNLAFKGLYKNWSRKRWFLKSYTKYSKVQISNLHTTNISALQHKYNISNIAEAMCQTKQSVPNKSTLTANINSLMNYINCILT